MLTRQKNRRHLDPFRVESHVSAGGDFQPRGFVQNRLSIPAGDMTIRTRFNTFLRGDGRQDSLSVPVFLSPLAVGRAKPGAAPAVMKPISPVSVWIYMPCRPTTRTQDELFRPAGTEGEGPQAGPDRNARLQQLGYTAAALAGRFFGKSRRRSIISARTRQAKSRIARS